VVPGFEEDVLEIGQGIPPSGLARAIVRSQV
jgi:hypothetical protein